MLCVCVFNLIAQTQRDYFPQVNKNLLLQEKKQQRAFEYDRKQYKINIFIPIPISQ